MENKSMEKISIKKISIKNKTFLLRDEDYPVFKAFYRSEFPEATEAEICLAELDILDL